MKRNAGSISPEQWLCLERNGGSHSPDTWLNRARNIQDKIDDIIVEYPETLLENEHIDGLEDVTILKYKFHPYKTTLLPGKYRVKEDNNIITVSLNICCEYKLILTE